MTQATYKDAGVDLDLYQQAMTRLPQFLQRTHRDGVMELPGGFAGLFRMNAGGRSYDDPVLVSGTDGVGTKIKVAIMAGRYNTIGIDLVAMCVNDCLCLGAEPLFFLDYIALGRDEPDLLAQLVEGVSEGCVQAGAALLGGETAIMPDLYADGDFDMAGFCVGVVERSAIVDGTQRIHPGDAVVGLASGGLHSNGYSLVRKVVFENAGLAIDDHLPDFDATVADVLLKPTRIYADVLRRIMAAVPGESVHGLAHITGGGLEENLERVLPDKRHVELKRKSWTCPPEFGWLQELGHVDPAEMFRVFNMGIGMAIVVDPSVADSVIDASQSSGVDAWRIGDVSEGERGVRLTNE